MHGGSIMEKIPIVIVSYNRKDMLKKCLKSIRSNTNDRYYELVLVDNGSDLETTKYIKKQKFNFDIHSVIRLPENEGFARGYNAGLKAIKDREFMIILNNDTEPAPGWLDFMKLVLFESMRPPRWSFKEIQTGLVLPYTNFCCNPGIVVEDAGVRTKTMRIEGNVPAVCWGITKECYFKVCEIIEKLDGGYNFFHNDFNYGWAEDILTSEIISRLGFDKYAAGGSFIYHHGSATQNILHVTENYRRDNMQKLGKCFKKLDDIIV